MRPMSSLALLFVLPGLAAAAEPANVLGGRVGARAGYVTAGFPDVEGGLVLPLSKKVDLTPRVRFAYYLPVAGPFDFGPVTLALEPGVRLRVQLLQAGDLQGALTANVDVGFGLTPGYPDPTFTIGLVEPGWAMTWRVADVVDLDFGIAIEPTLVIPLDGWVTAVVALPLSFGGEFEVADRIAVLARFEGGPAFVTAGGGVGYDFVVRGVVGASFGF